MFKDKNIQERKAIVIQQYTETMTQFVHASSAKKRAKTVLGILKNQMEVLNGLEETTDA